MTLMILLRVLRSPHHDAVGIGMHSFNHRFHVMCSRCPKLARMDVVAHAIIKVIRSHVCPFGWLGVTVTPVLIVVGTWTRALLITYSANCNNVMPLSLRLVGRDRGMRGIGGRIILLLLRLFK